MLERLSIRTSARTAMIDITSKFNRLWKGPGKVRNLHCFCSHTTAGITINENADPDVVSDILTEINKIVPFEDGYSHGEEIPPPI